MAHEDYRRLYKLRNKMPHALVAKCSGEVFKIPARGETRHLSARQANHLMRVTTTTKGVKQLEMIEVVADAPVAVGLNLAGLSKSELIAMAIKGLGDPPAGMAMEPREMSKEQIIAAMHEDSWLAAMPKETVAEPGEKVVYEAPEEPAPFPETEEDAAEAEGPVVVKKKEEKRSHKKRKPLADDEMPPEL